ncbi:MAG: tetratricopeptide repeat protein [Thermoanaerobaculia bacterium]|nr:tetratricopeptide repeat protein [Thermoanaerobaculia bacterium]
MAGGRRVVGVVLITLCQSLTFASIGGADLPPPRLDRFEPSVRDQIEALYRAATQETESADPVAQARPYGFLGETYLAFELPEEARLALEEAARLDPQEPRWTYLRALAALGAGRRADAAELFDEILHRRADDLPTLLRSAANHLDLGQIDEARSKYERAGKLIEEDSAPPGSAAVIRFGLGQLAALAERHEEAVGHYRQTIELQPEANAVYYHLARSLHRLGDPEAAREALTRRGDRAPSFHDPVLASVQRRAQGPQADLLRGLKALDAGRLDIADALLHRVVEQRPDDAEALAGLGRIHQIRGESDAAERAYRKSLESDAGSYRVLLNLGVLLAERGDAEALDLLRRAVTADPLSSAAHLNLGLELLRRTELEPAEQVFRRATELNPEDADALDALARSQAAQGRFTSAITSYQRLLDMDPQRSEAYFALGLSQTLAGRCGEAGPVLSRAFETFGSEGPEGLARVGLLARILATCPDAEIRDGARAVELAQTLFRRSPSLETGRTLSMALAEAGRFDEAAEQLRRLITAVSRSGATAALPGLRRELALYESHQPVRSPWDG